MPATRIVLVEGACGVGKSTLIAALARRRDDAGTSTQVFSQRQTYAPIAPSEDLGILDDELNYAILTRIVRAIATTASEQENSSLLLVDTLHLTQLVRPGVLALDSFLRIERQIAPILSMIVFLRAQQETFWTRVVEARRGTAFREYIERYAQGDAGLLRYLIETQEQLLQILREHSGNTRTLVLDCELPIDELAERVSVELATAENE